MLEGPVYNLVVERIKNAKIQNNCNPHIPGYPFIKTKFKYVNEDLKLEYAGWEYVAKMMSSVINDTEKKSGQFVGVQLGENNAPPTPQKFELPTLTI